MEHSLLLRARKPRNEHCIKPGVAHSRGGGIGFAPLLEAVEEAGLNPDQFILREEGWLSEFELGIRATMDREEAAKIAQRMADVRAHEARAGKPRPGIARGYGYERDCLTVIDTEAILLREAAAASVGT